MYGKLVGVAIATCQVRFLCPVFQFIRFADIKLEDDMQCRCMKKLLLDVWQLPKPKLVISVTGGARDFRFDSHVKKAFSEGDKPL